jgi:hypothetical protein
MGTFGTSVETIGDIWADLGNLCRFEPICADLKCVCADLTLVCANLKPWGADLNLICANLNLATLQTGNGSKPLPFSRALALRADTRTQRGQPVHLREGSLPQLFSCQRAFCGNPRVVLATDENLSLCQLKLSILRRANFSASAFDRVFGLSHSARVELRQQHYGVNCPNWISGYLSPGLGVEKRESWV